MDNLILSQLKSSSLPEELYSVVLEKLKGNCYDAGNYFLLSMEESDEAVSEASQSEEITNSNENLSISIEERLTAGHEDSYQLLAKEAILSHSTVILIDHMWMTTFPQSRIQLKEYPSLTQRIGEALNLSTNDDGEYDIDRVWEFVWPHFGCFKTPQDDYTKWYLMDEVGIAIQHSRTPNFMCIPLIVSDGLSPAYTISVAWPIADISEGETITRNYLDKTFIGNEKMQVINSLAFKYRYEIDELLEHDEALFDYLSPSTAAGKEAIIDTTALSTPEYEPIQSLTTVEDHLNAIIADKTRLLKVFCDRSDHMNSEHFKHSKRIQLVENIIDADILYLIDHTIDGNKEYNKLNKMSNQFIWNGLIITKDELVATVKNGHKLLKQHPSNEIYPSWLPETYNLSNETEICQFLVSYFHHWQRDDNPLNNLWILKNHCGKQSLDYPIASNLSCLLRHCEISSRIASRYIVNPLLLQGRKFDLRYHILVHSFEPLVLSRHEIFLVRIANQTFTLDNFEEYQKHFTVMNFIDSNAATAATAPAVDLHDIRGEGKRINFSVQQFCELFDEQMKSQQITWMDDIQPKIHETIKELFQYTHKVYENTMAAHTVTEAIPSFDRQSLHPNSAWTLNQPNVTVARSMFGVDIMVTEDYQPKVLEVQWAPDCAKALELHPSFWEDILSALYLGETNNTIPF